MEHGELVHREAVRGVALSMLYRLRESPTPCDAYDAPRTQLQSAVLAISAEHPAAAELRITSGPYFADTPYVVLIGASGDEPGIALSSWVTVPLNPDAITTFALTASNGPPFRAFRGKLDSEGSAIARLGPFPPGLLAPLVGSRLTLVAGFLARPAFSDPLTILIEP